MIPCPTCSSPRSEVLESGPAGRRRRKCEQCGHRWTTYEIDKLELERLRRIAQRARELAQEAAT